MPTEAPAAAAEILLLEENTDAAALIGKAAENSNLSVVAACPEILGYLRREGKYEQAPRPDLILLDLDLSRKEDCEMLSDIKKDAVFKRIPVVVLASSDSYANIFQAYDLHANAYICKPPDQEQFLTLVRATLHFWLALVRLPRE